MVLEHRLDAFEDRGGAGLKPPEAIGDLPERHDAGSSQAHQCDHRGWVHAGKRTAPMQGSGLASEGQSFGLDTRDSPLIPKYLECQPQCRPMLLADPRQERF